MHPEFDGIINIYVGVAHGIFLEQFRRFGIEEITLVWEGSCYASTDIAEYFSLAIDGFASQAAPDVAVN